MSKKHSLDLLTLEKDNDGFPSSCLLKSKVEDKRQPTFKVAKSSVLNSVKAFLPRLAAANGELESTLKTVPASFVDIENTEDCDGPIIEMNLALVDHPDSDSDSSESGCEFDSDSDSDSSSDSLSKTVSPVCQGEVTEVNLKLPNRKLQKNSGIVVLSDKLCEMKPDSSSDNAGDKKSDKILESNKSVSSDGTVITSVDEDLDLNIR